MEPTRADGTKTYELCLPGKRFLLAIFGLQGLAVLSFLAWALLSDSADAPPWQIGIIWLAALCLVWLQALFIPYRILLSREGNVTFQSVLRAKSFHLSEIRSIAPRPRRFGFFVLDYGRGKQRFLVQFTGFHEFLAILKEANPAVTLRGC